MNKKSKLTTITEQLEQATVHLEEIRAQMAQFEGVETVRQFKAAIKGGAGNGKALYLEHKPLRQALEARNHGEKQYLYFYFSKRRKRFRWSDDEAEGYEGPTGKRGLSVRKLYVGNDPDAQARGRVMVENLKRYEELAQVEDRLEAWIESLTQARDALIRRSQSWPRVDLATLGPAAVQDLVAVSPNEMGAGA